MRLSNLDLQRVLFSVNQLASDHEPESLPQRTIDSVKGLISTDVVSFEGFGIDNNYRGPLWFAPVENVSNEMLAAIGKYAPEHPCFNGSTAHKLRETVRVSDFLPLAEFKRTAIYNEFFRRLGTDRQIVGGLHISKNLTITGSLCRLGKDYSDRDCQMFDLLNPHLTVAFRNARLVRRLKSETEHLQAAIESSALAVVTIDSNFNLSLVSAGAARLLRKYFQSKSAALPDELLRYIKHHLSIFTGDDFYLPPFLYEKTLRGGKLLVRLAFHAASRSMTLFFEEISASSDTFRTAQGLTKRESEVVFWIGSGKTDGDIAKILKISARTVQKHVENIFNKLGVETRTAAVSKISSK